MGDSNWMTTGVGGAGGAEAARQIECPPTIRTAARAGSQISTAFMIDGHQRGAEVPASSDKCEPAVSDGKVLE
jgi:hypothetical protein